MEQLAELAKELGTPGQAKLYRAARKKGIEVSKLEVHSFLAKKGEKQIFRPLPESKDKTRTEGPGFRAQMDMIDLKYSKSQGNKNILVVIDVFTRKVWAKTYEEQRTRSSGPGPAADFERNGYTS